MRFRKIRAFNFRNFDLLEAEFPTGAQFIRGGNGQGKTNLLEALGLVTSLRSFRTSDMPSLIRWQAQPRQAALLFEIEHEQLGSTHLEIRLRAGSRQILLDGAPVQRLGEIIGTFPTITFSSHDIQILRGAPTLRRRFMDMMFVVMHADYYGVLARYHQALKARNALLKQLAPASQLLPFEAVLLREGWALSCLRAELLKAFRPHFEEAYAGISGVDEAPQLALDVSLAADDAAAFSAAFRAGLRRDQETRTTQRGPHRDDLEIRLLGHMARDFASEGQQRGLVLALRMGLFNWYKRRGGTTPVILADDIVGELDPQRRAGFWELIGTSCQLIASGTILPAEARTQSWIHWEMEQAKIRRQTSSSPEMETREEAEA